MPIKSWIKDRVSESTRQRLRHFGRVRWITKARVVRHYSPTPWKWWSYVLFDPEVDSFTYPIANQAELSSALARVLDRDVDEILAYVLETGSDPTLRGALEQPLSHLAWAKRRPEPHSYHQASWATVRSLRPTTVVETGILDGMASTVILSALEKNAREGWPGELISFDVMQGAGKMVPAHLRKAWHPVYEDAAQAMDRALEGRRVGALFCDSLPDARQIRRELDAALAHRDRSFVALTSWGWIQNLDWPTSSVVRFTEVPVGHFYNGETLAMARFD